MEYYLCADIGGTHIRAALFDAGESPTARRRAVIPTFGDEPVLERLKRLLQAVAGNTNVKGIGVACPGPLDPATGIILSAPNIPGWENLPLKAILEDQFGVKTKIDNDANLAALGEWKYGAGRGFHHLLYLTISTGIGAGIIIEDRLLHGANGLAGELGHVTVEPGGQLCGCGKRGHLEAMASGKAIARMAEEALQKGAVSLLKGANKPLTAADVAAAANAGDKVAREVLERAGKYLGRAIADFLHIFNPEAVILGGGVSKAGEPLLAPLRRSLHASVMHPAYLDNLVLTQATLGDDAGLLGALAMIKQDLATRL